MPSGCVHVYIEGLGMSSGKKLSLSFAVWCYFLTKRPPVEMIQTLKCLNNYAI